MSTQTLSVKRRGGMRKSLGVAASAVALAGFAVVGGATAASASTQGTCGQIFNPSTGDGHAHWTLSCSGGRIYMDGYVVDDDADGLCAQVKGQFNDATYYSAKACPKGTRRDFHWSGPGSLADGYLFFS
jgi:hypothetical protein